MDHQPRRSVVDLTDLPAVLPAWRAYGSQAQEVGCAPRCALSCAPAVSPRGELEVFFPNSLPVGGFLRVSSESVVVFAGHRPRKPDVYSLVREIIKDPPTQAVAFFP